MSLASKLRRIAVALFGAGISAVCGFFLHQSFHQTDPSEKLQLALMAGFGLGLLVIAPALIVGAVKQVIVFLPEVRIGGKRHNDPPAP